MSTKDRVLALLESAGGESISGEWIGGQLNISRNAVWKAIKDLKKDGYGIEAVTNRGYRLKEGNDILSVQGMLPYLREGVNPKQIFLHGSLESTNKTAKEMAISGAVHGTVIIADRQTGGRGRYGRAFYSPPGCGVYISFILRPECLRLETPTMITAFAAVAVCEAVEAVSEKQPRIKWVNDICLEGKKISGILTEAVTDYESGGTQWIVTGIGVNFRMCPEDFPEDLRPIAGAVYQNERHTATRNRLAAELINRILNHSGQYSEREILDHYRKRLLMLGEEITVDRAGESYEAIALDIDEAGRLLIRKENGETEALSFGEIRIRSSKGKDGSVIDS